MLYFGSEFTPATAIFFKVTLEVERKKFLKTVTLSVLVWAYPREMKTNDGNLKMPTFYLDRDTMERLSFPFLLRLKFQAC